MPPFFDTSGKVDICFDFKQVRHQLPDSLRNPCIERASAGSLILTALGGGIDQELTMSIF
ncbi:MAG: hypothetical protein IPJ46_21060 [Anaerolineales bacterium]|nr:hypothetical protein [Anaerolineales bacterium]